MKVLFAVAIGYVVGAKSGGKDLDQLGRSVKALCDTDEFADVVAAARAHLGQSLREVAGMIDGQRDVPLAGSDLVSRVMHLVDHERP